MLAYKVLDYRLSDDTVQSLMNGTSWTNAELKAEHKRPSSGPFYRFIVFEEKRGVPAGHEAPHVDCDCGIYGVLSHAQIPLWLYESYTDNTDHKFVCVIELYGRIIEHEKGYRAEYARPVAVLDYLHGWPPLMKPDDGQLMYTAVAVKASRVLGVPVHDFGAYDNPLPRPTEFTSLADLQERD